MTIIINLHNVRLPCVHGELTVGWELFEMIWTCEPPLFPYDDVSSSAPYTKRPRQLSLHFLSLNLEEQDRIERSVLHK